MKRNQLIVLIGCFLLSVLILTTLYIFSPLSQEEYRGTFVRTFTRLPEVEESGVVDLHYNSYYVAGATSNHVYLGNWTAPFHMVVVNTAQLDTQQVRIKLKNIDKFDGAELVKVKVDSPFFFLTQGKLPKLFRGTINQWEADHFMPDSAFFVEGVPIGPSSFALRSYSITNKEFELAKEKADTPYFNFNYDLLEKQIDGLFCVDGALHYDKQLHQLVYLYHYRNQYIVMDTNLNLAYRSNTIDTFKHAQIKVAKIASRNYSTMASPPARINGQSCTYGDYLFVQSNVIAKNEDRKIFRKSSVIDVYNLKTGVYSHSFYLPNYKEKRLMGFKVFDNKLAAVFDKYLVLYDLNLKPLNSVSEENERNRITQEITSALSTDKKTKILPVKNQE